MLENREVRAYFEGVARQWDRLRQDYYGIEVIEKALAAAGLLPPFRFRWADRPNPWA